MVRRVTNEDIEMLDTFIAYAVNGNLAIVTTQWEDGTDVAVVAHVDNDSYDMSMHPLAIIVTDDIFSKIKMPTVDQ